MSLEEKIISCFGFEYGIPEINPEPIIKSINDLSYSFNYNLFKRYRIIKSLSKRELTCFNEDLAILFLKENEFEDDRQIIDIGKKSERSENSVQAFYSRIAKKERIIADISSREETIIPKEYSKNFLRKALKHKLICEDKSYWKNPDNDIQHLRFISHISNKLFYYSRDLDEQIWLLELNYNSLIKKGEGDRIDKDSGFNYTRRLLECTANLAFCYYSFEIEKSREFINKAVGYFYDLKDDNLEHKRKTSLYSINKTINTLIKVLDKPVLSGFNISEEIKNEIINYNSNLEEKLFTLQLV